FAIAESVDDEIKTESSGPPSEVIGDLCFGEWRWPRDCRSNCDYRISWNFAEASDEIEFSLETKISSNWWSGVGFSKSGTMKDADLIVVKSFGGILSLHDMSSNSYSTPKEDPIKNVYTPTVVGSHSNGILRAQFTRKRNTGDINTDAIFTDNECFHFLFPVSGGRLNADGDILKHINTPHVTPQKVCIKSCQVDASGEQESEPTCTNEFKFPENCKGDACDYIAKWNYNETRDEVRFEVKSRGIGRWTGVGISKDGAMANSDIYTGWVYNGKAYVVDRFAYGRQLPAIDPADRQDLYDIGGKIEDEYQV
uniref:DOMON domain-containing protein n=1 Tax=Panagrolaimus sp. PS1159 TaxID=55785 RepID=A0AC35FE97_9BILA